MDFIDPHFHYWDITPPSPSGHDRDIIKNPAVYTPVEYIEDMRSSGLTLKKAVFIEALSNLPLAEANWVTHQINLHTELVGNIPHKIVAYADLTQDSNVVEELLSAYSKNPLIVGIRQILNHHPENPNITWPKVSRDYLLDSTWVKNFSLLEKYGFSFDFQGNPHQVQAAVQIFKDHPKIPVVVDHLGTPNFKADKDLDAAMSVWREGMKALASLPHVHIKLSMLAFIYPPENEKYPQSISELVHEVIALFGSNRCMFASNYPVDKPQVSPKAMYDQFQEFTKDMDRADVQNLFFNSANEFYKF